MNKIEATVYNIVRKNPALKQAIRNLYQSAFDLLPKQKNQFDGEVDCREGYFFGFHDVTPFSKDDSKILAHQLDFDLRMPKPGEGIEVGYFDLKDGKFADWHKIGTSLAWNYHKGCRLQWVDDDHVIYNSSKGGKPVAVIKNINNGTEKVVDAPIDAIYNDGKTVWATSFSYERLNRCMPGYGYPYTDGGRTEECHPADTGLYMINTATGEKELIVTLDDLAKSLPEDMREDCLHFVTHTEFSKDGRYISFLYRRIPVEGDYMKRWTQIRVYDRQTKEVIVLPSDDSGSHYVWNGRNQIIASCFINGMNCHKLFDMANMDASRIIAPEVLNSDGHQTFYNDDVFVTDTYPNRRRMSKMIVANCRAGECRTIASVYSPKKFQTKDFKCHIACDLHPRFSESGKLLSFDSPTSGKRGLYIMKTEDLIK